MWSETPTIINAEGTVGSCWSAVKSSPSELYRLRQESLCVPLTCSEAQLVLLLAFVVVQRSHSHTFAHILIERICSSVGVVPWVRGRLVLVRPLRWRSVCLVLLVAADTEGNVSAERVSRVVLAVPAVVIHYNRVTFHGLQPEHGLLLMWLLSAWLHHCLSLTFPSWWCYEQAPGCTPT